MLVLQPHSLISSLMTWLSLMSRLNEGGVGGGGWSLAQHSNAEISQVHSVELGSRHMTGWALHTQQPNTLGNWRELLYSVPLSLHMRLKISCWCLQKNYYTTNIPPRKGQLCSIQLIAFDSIALTYPSLSGHASEHTLAVMCLWSTSKYLHSL